jgi:hypothetical protein
MSEVTVSLMPPNQLEESHMSSVPIAVSRLGDGDSHESQNVRAVDWLLKQPGGPIVVVTPKRDFEGESLKRLIARPGVTHHVWRGFVGTSFDGQRVLYAWPGRKRLNRIWNSDADAIAVIEWNINDTAEWIEDTAPVQLFPGQIVTPQRREEKLEPLPNGVDAILEHIASMAAGYSSGLKWNEEDKLKADMMNCPDRWAAITVEQVRAKCRQLGMRPDDVDTISGFLHRRKEGRRFSVRSSYRTFQFN